MSTSEKVDAWMPLWIGEYLADTMALTRDQHGGYLLLLFAYWRNKGPLADDAEELAAIARATPAEWKKLGPRLARFFEVRDGLWIHTRADKELNAAGIRKSTAVAKAKAAAEARWGKPSGTPSSNASGNAPSMQQALHEDCPKPSPSSPIGEDINDASGERPKYPPEFEAAWQAYPDRPGDSKANAHKAWAARRKGGVTAEVLLAGAQRYAAFCTASATEPQYVKQAATFFGPGEHYLADWTPVARSQPAANQPRRDARDAWLSGIGSTFTPGDQHAEPDQRTVDVEARFVG